VDVFERLERVIKMLFLSAAVIFREDVCDV